MIFRSNHCKKIQLKKDNGPDPVHNYFPCDHPGQVNMSFCVCACEFVCTCVFACECMCVIMRMTDNLIFLKVYN